MTTLSAYLNSETKIAFDGKTYFVKFLDSVNGWLPVQSINYNPVNNTFKVVGVYGLNVGKRQNICNRKGLSVGTTGFTFKARDLETDNCIKLYKSNVTTKIETVYPQNLLKEAYKFNEELTTYRQLVHLATSEDNKKVLLNLVPEEFRDYI